MEVRLLEHTHLSSMVIGARTCLDSFHKGGNYSSPTDRLTLEDQGLLKRLIHKNKHESIMEHVVYVFNIKGLSRLSLQELARHRIASLSVKSSRYTLKEIKNKTLDELFNIPDDNLRPALLELLNILRLKEDLRNDMLKYLCPESLKTDLVWTINARSLKNFFELRQSSQAHFEIHSLANEVFKALPPQHRFLYWIESQPCADTYIW